jgi:hypothetical protein
MYGSNWRGGAGGGSEFFLPLLAPSKNLLGHSYKFKIHHRNSQLKFSRLAPFLAHGMLLGYGSRNLHVSSSTLICRFQCSWAWNVQITGAIPNRPRREAYFMSSHMLYLTSQSIKLNEFVCVLDSLWSLQKQWSKRANGWRDMQFNVPFPLESTYLGCRCTTCAFSPVILYAGRLV